MFKYVFPDKVWCYGLIANSGASVNIALYFLIVIAIMAVAYLCGSINSAVIISKLRYSEDIRTKGSGNAGMTNMMRSYGKGPAALTLLGDMLKTMVGMIVGTLLLGLTGAYIAGLFCILGHIAPIFYHFKGGKGVASTAMVILYIDIKIFIIIVLFFVLIVWSTKYLSMGSIICELFMPLLLYRNEISVWKPFSPTDSWLRVILSLLMAGIVVFMHRSNIKRIMNGEENKFHFKKTVKPSDNPGNGDETEGKK